MNGILIIAVLSVVLFLINEAISRRREQDRH